MTNRDILDVIQAMLDTSRDRETYAWAVLLTFGYAVAKLAANPATLIERPEEEDAGLYSETERLVTEWAKRCAAELDELLAATY